MHDGSDCKTMPERLKYALELNGLTASELAKKSGILKSSLSMYLKGSHEATRSTAEKMAAVLNVSPAWLMGYDVPLADEKIREAPIRVIDLSQKRFIQVGNSMVNLSHVIVITMNKDGTVTVSLDNGTTVVGTIVE